MAQLRVAPGGEHVLQARSGLPPLGRVDDGAEAHSLRSRKMVHCHHHHHLNHQERVYQHLLILT